MSIFFGASPSITMKRTETSRTGFCLLEGIRNRGRSFLVLGALAVVRANRSSKAGTRGRTAHGPAVTSIPLRFRDGWTDGPLREGGAVSPMPNISVYTHNMYTNANILHSIYICL